jgi:hypothetical protein
MLRGGADSVTWLRSGDNVSRRLETWGLHAEKKLQCRGNVGRRSRVEDLGYRLGGCHVGCHAGLGVRPTGGYVRR